MTKRYISTDKTSWSPGLLPQQVVLVSTADATGTANVCPVSWISMVAYDGPILAFSTNTANATWRNLHETGAFAINIPTEPLSQTIWNMPSSHGAERIAAAGLSLAPAKTIAAPLVDDCVGHLECSYETEQLFGTTAMVFGRVRAVALDPALLDGSLEERYARFRPVFSLEDATFGTLGGLIRLD